MSRSDNETFVLQESGLYRVEFNLQGASFITATGAQVTVNGVGYGPLFSITSSSFIATDNQLSGAVLLDATAGDVVEIHMIVPSGAAATVEGANLIITQLTSETTPE